MDDETLMAFADGELDAARRAEVEAAIARDPELARRVAEHRALRATVSAAFAPVLDRTVPEKLRAAARGPATGQAGHAGNVVAFPKRGSASSRQPWRAREWMAIAASFVIGAFVSWQVMSPPGGMLETSGGALVARGELARALDQSLAADNSADGAISLGVSFQSKDGGYCRQFALRAAQTAGLACREGAEWRIPVTAAAAIPAGEVQQAAGSMPPAILSAIEARMTGDALDAAAEAAALRDGWKPARQP